MYPALDRSLMLRAIMDISALCDLISRETSSQSTGELDGLGFSRLLGAPQTGRCILG